VFHYENENSLIFDSDITDHWVENNTTIQDHIGFKPITITVQGFIGELNDVVPDLEVFRIAKLLSEKLFALSAYIPAVSITALQAYNAAFQAYQIANNTANNVVTTWNTITNQNNNNEPQNLQQKMFAALYGYYSNRTLFTVQTPWQKFDDMAIKTVKAIQSGDSRTTSEFEVTFKQIRKAETKLTPGFNSGNIEAKNTQGRLSAQSSKTVNLGTSTPPETSFTFTEGLGNIA
jgi:hypothetical protein